MNSRYLAAIGTIIGTVIGAGILALPYAVSKSGFLVGVILILVVGIASILIMMYTGELSFRLKKIHQLPVLISKYTGKRFRLAILILQVLILYGAILAYLIAMGDSLQTLLGVPYILSVLLVFALSAPIIYQGYRWVEDAEVPLSAIKLSLIIIVAFIVLFSAKVNNLAAVNTGNIFAPFGVILFAMMGFSVIPEIREEVSDNKNDFNKAIIISMIITILIYIFFAAAFVGAFGPSVSAIATNSITSGSFSFFYYLLTIFLVVTPYIALSLVIVDAFNYDFKIKRNYSFWLTMLIPLGLALLNLNFAHVLQITGGILLPILSLMILITIYRERRIAGKSKIYNVPGGIYLLIFTAVVMILGFCYTLAYVLL